MERAEEARLISRIVAGDREAAGALVRAHQRSLHSFLLGMGNRADVAEDLVQEAFVRALTNIHRFDPRFRFSTWLFVIARRLYINAEQKKRPRFDTDFVELRGEENAPELRIDAEDERSASSDLLTSSLAELSLVEREVLVLFHQQDWPIAMIAEQLGMPEGTVKSHLHRGRRRLREVIERREASEASAPDRPARPAAAGRARR